MSYFDLGTYSRPGASASNEAQTWFDRGLNWTFGFNHEEAADCFRKAIAADRTCAWAYWGLAFAIGPNYNKEWDFFELEERISVLKEAHEALSTAKAQAGIDTVAAAMIEALTARYPTDPEVEDFGPWNDAFADAMRPIYAAHPNDLEVATIFAEALMNRTPWGLWDIEKKSTVRRRVDRRGAKRSRNRILKQRWRLGPSGVVAPLYPPNGDVALARAGPVSWGSPAGPCAGLWASGAYGDAHRRAVW